MRRLILFSMPSEEVFQKIFPSLFPIDMPQKILACMPSDGALGGRRFELFRESWQSLAHAHQAEILFIDNSVRDATEEHMKLRQANILMMTGGNVCQLLSNLRHSGLDQAILAFARKDPAIIAGYSAGAMVCTPSVAFAAFAPEENENTSVGLTNFEALHLIDYEILPHYTEDLHLLYERYARTARHSVRFLRDDEFLIHEW